MTFLKTIFSLVLVTISLSAMAAQVDKVSASNEPEAYFQVATAPVGNALYVWGGNAFSQPVPGRIDSYVVNSGRIYDPVSDTWKTISTVNAPTARRLAFGFEADRKFVVWGGCLSNFIIDKCDKAAFDGGVYDPSTDTWTKISELPYQECTQLASDSGAAVFYDGKLLVTNCLWRTSADQFVHQYDFTTQTWSKISLNSGFMNYQYRALTSRARAEAAIFQWGRFGGPLRFMSYNLNTDVRTDLSLPLFNVDPDGSPLFHKGNVVIVGGGQGLSAPDENIRASAYNVKTALWTALPEFPRRGSVRLLSHNDSIISWGGNREQSSSSSGAKWENFDDLKVLVDGGSAWKEVLPSTTAAGLEFSRQNAAFVSLGDWIVIWGGAVPYFHVNAPSGLRIKIN